MEFIKYTTGLECWVETRGAVSKEKLALVKVEFERDGEQVKGTLISARNSNAIKSYRPVIMTADAWSDRPQDPYDDTVEALWALDLFGLRAAALD